MKLPCWLVGGHDWDRVTETMYVKERSEFTNNADAYAGARCRRCGTVSLGRLYGHYHWSGYEEISYEEAIARVRKAAYEAAS